MTDPLTDEQLAEIQARSDVGVWLTGAWACDAGEDRRRLLAEVRRQREVLDKVRALSDEWVTNTQDGQGVKREHWRGDDFVDGQDEAAERHAEQVSALLSGSRDD